MSPCRRRQTAAPLQIAGAKGQGRARRRNLPGGGEPAEDPSPRHRRVGSAQRRRETRPRTRLCRRRVMPAHAVAVVCTWGSPPRPPWQVVAGASRRPCQGAARRASPFPVMSGGAAGVRLRTCGNVVPPQEHDTAPPAPGEECAPSSRGWRTPLEPRGGRPPGREGDAILLSFCPTRPIQAPPRPHARPGRASGGPPPGVLLRRQHRWKEVASPVPAPALPGPVRRAPLRRTGFHPRGGRGCGRSSRALASSEPLPAS